MRWLCLWIFLMLLYWYIEPIQVNDIITIELLSLSLLAICNLLAFSLCGVLGDGLDSVVGKLEWGWNWDRDGMGWDGMFVCVYGTWYLVLVVESITTLCCDAVTVVGSLSFHGYSMVQIVIHRECTVLYTVFCWPLIFWTGVRTCITRT